MCVFVVSNKVILSAVVGSLSCALLLVIALSVMCRFVRQPSTRRSSRHISPITAIEEHIYAQRSAPPPYPEAMATSRPFDEHQHAVSAESAQTEGPGHVDESCNMSAVTQDAVDNSDDDLINVAVNDTPSGGGDDIVIALECLTRWHCQPKPSADSSESSIIAVDDSPTNAPAGGDSVPDIQVSDTADTLMTACDQRARETAAEDEDDHLSNDDDDRPLLTC